MNQDPKKESPKENKPEGKKPSLLLRILKIIVIILLIVILTVGAVLLHPLLELHDHTKVAGSADWMAKLDDGLRLSEVNIPGTHNSGTQYVDLMFFSRCQSMSVKEQLEAGYRYLDIRVGVTEPGGELVLMHGFTVCRPSYFTRKPLLLRAVVEECAQFLAKHPTETVLFVVKHEHGDISTADMERKIDEIVTGAPGQLWYEGDTLPTVGEARGKIVLLRRYADEAGIGPRAGIDAYWNDQGGVGDNGEYNMAGQDGLLWVQDRYEYDTEDKWAAFLEALEEPLDPEDVGIHFLSTKGTLAYGHPAFFARRLNKRLLKQDLPPQSEGHFGWVIVDFGTAELAAHIYGTMFD